MAGVTAYLVHILLDLNQPGSLFAFSTCHGCGDNNTNVHATSLAFLPTWQYLCLLAP